jgi:DNA-binding PucR family transcriptional regulator
MEPATTLGTLVEALGGGFVEVLTSPRGLDVRVSEPVILDRSSGLPVADGDLLLAVGVALEGDEALEVIRLAAAGEAAGVIFKLDGDVPPAVIEAAEAAGMALGGVPAGTAWGQLFTLLRTACDASRTSLWSPGVAPAIGDLFSLANAIAATLGGATTIEDRSSVVLAYSSLDQPIDRPRRDTILGRRVPKAWMTALEQEGVFNRLYQNGEVVRIERLSDSVDSISRLSIAVRAGGEILGSIWVAEGDDAFDGGAEEALRGAAEIAALHLLRHRAAADVERERRAELLRSLLDGELPVSGMGALGIDRASLQTVLALEPELGPGSDAEVLRQRVVAVVALYAEVYRRSAATVALGDVVYLLFPTAEGLQRARLLQLATDLTEQIENAVKVPVRAGVGMTVRHLSDVHESRAEADRVLDALRRSSVGPRVADAAEVHSQIALAHLEDLATQEPLLHGGKLQRLTEHDAERGSSYVETLHEYLDAFGEIPKAAARLQIHVNTLRYRLARLLEISEIDLDDPEERLVTHLQLQLTRRPGRS